MDNRLLAKTSVTIEAPIAKVWDALVNPKKIKQYMFGTTVISDWEEGSSIAWKGEWKGKSYKDKGKILQLKPKEKLQYTHFSPLSGQEDKPENYHTVTIELNEQDGNVHLSLTQDNNDTEKARDHSEENWKKMLTELKRMVENK